MSVDDGDAVFYAIVYAEFIGGSILIYLLIPLNEDEFAVATRFGVYLHCRIARLRSMGTLVVIPIIRNAEPYQHCLPTHAEDVGEFLYIIIAFFCQMIYDVHRHQ